MNASMPSPVVAKFPGQSKFYRMECEDEVIILSLEYYMGRVYFVSALGPSTL